MNFKRYLLIITLGVCTLFIIKVNANVDDNYSVEFKTVAFQSCDKVFHKLEDGCPDMICRDILVNAWAECWKKSMHFELNKRLLKLKNTDITEFHFEMTLQKIFNEATRNLCRKDCGSKGTMKGIPYNFCRVDAYKYRTSQAIQINKNQLTIPTRGHFLPEKVKKEKTKDTNYYKAFSENFCKMTKAVWSARSQPTDCQKKVLTEIDSFEFTDNVCDLS